MEIKVVPVPVFDMGIGRSAGFADDAALIVEYERLRAEMPESARKIIDAVDAEVVVRFVGG